MTVDIGKCVIVHPMLGVYLANIDGMGVFSAHPDTYGLITAEVFEDEGQAKSFIEQMFSDATPDQFTFFALPKQYEDGDTICLQAAGVPVDLLGGMLKSEVGAIKKLKRKGMKLN